MVDLSFGPEPGPRLNPGLPVEAYLIQTRRRRLYSLVIFVLFAALMAAGFHLAEGRNAGSFRNGLPHLFDFPAEILSEAWRDRAGLPGLMAQHLPALVETLNIAAVSTLLGGISAAVLALLSTRGLARFPRLIPVFRRLADTLRALPDVVIALVLIFLLGGGPMPAVIAIALHTTGALGKLFSEVAENADPKPIEGLASVGATWTQRMAFGLIPQVAPNWLSYALLRFEINVRASAILGFVGQGGIGADLKVALQWGTGRYDQVVAIFALIFLTIALIDQASGRLRQRLIKGSSGPTPPLATSFRRRKLMSLAVPTLILLYLFYAASAFDITGLAARMRWDNAATLLSDFVSYKVHVTEDASGHITSTIGGDLRDAYPAALTPDFVKTAGEATTITLPGGVVTYGPTITAILPDYGTLSIARDTSGKLTLQTPPGPLPDFVSASDSKVTVLMRGGRLNVFRTKAETWVYQPGWASFFFTLDSPFAGKGWGELAALALWQPRLDPATPNAWAMLNAVWTNRLWHHNEVAWAMFETVLMAFLGTFAAGVISLPLAFLAARNILPFAPLRLALRRLFDFIRSTDALIWTLLLVRAFGPGPMTGALAILMTDTGAFGKLFSEAIENIDERQVEGIRATGGTALHRARFGILPQVAPVLLSQLLYALESNTRSATLIGAIVGGGIGLLLTQAIQTQKDWADVAYYLVLIVLTVIAMDAASGWLRRKLIKGE